MDRGKRIDGRGICGWRYVDRGLSIRGVRSMGRTERMLATKSGRRGPEVVEGDFDLVGPWRHQIFLQEIFGRKVT